MSAVAESVVERPVERPNVHGIGNIHDTPATNLRNALQIITGVVQDELRLIGYKVDGLSCSAITHEEIEGIQNRIAAALAQLELQDRERAGILKGFLERA